MAFFQAEDYDKKNSFFILGRNHGLSDKGAKEPQTEGVCQVLPWMSESNAEVHKLRGGVL